MEDQIFEEVVPHAELFMERAHQRDRAGMDAVLAEVQYLYGVLAPADAIAVVLAELYFVDRARLEFLEKEFEKVSAERDKFATHYGRSRNKVLELRRILDQKGADIAAKNRKKVA